MPVDKITLLIDSRVKEALNDLDKVQNSSKKTAAGFEVLKSGWFKLAAAAAVAAVGIKKAFDLNKEFLQFQQSVQAMERQFSVSADNIVKELRKVSKGTVSTKDLVLSANKAMALGVTKDIGQMSQLLAIARERGKALGVDTTQAFEDIVTGIGRASPLILDNLGIITKGWDKQAKAQGKAMDAQFILNKVLADGSELLAKQGAGAITGAEKIQRFNATIDNSRLLLGQLINKEIATFQERMGDLGKIDGLKIVEKSFKVIAVVLAIVIRQFQVLFNVAQIALSPIVLMIKTLSTLDVTSLKGFIESAKNIPDAFGDAFESVKNGVKRDGKDIVKVGEDIWERIKDVSKDTALEIGKLSPSEALRLRNEEALRKKDEDDEKAKQKILDRQKITDAALISASKAFFSIQEQLRSASLERQLKMSQDALQKEIEFLETERREGLKAIEEKFSEEDKLAEEQEFADKIARLEAEKAEAIRVGDEELSAALADDIAEAESDKKKKEEKAARDAQRAAEEIALNERLDAEKEALEEEADERERKLKKKGWLIDKAASLTEIAFSTAAAIMKIRRQLGVLPGVRAAMIATGIQGAAQAAIVASKPMPQFAEGTDFAPGGAALVGERGPEIVNLPRGSQVIPNNIINNESNDLSKREFHFHGIQDLSEARNQLIRLEGEGAF